MKKTFSIVFAVTVLLGGCAPSAPFKIGKGYYSEEHAKLQVEEAESENRIEKIGAFETEASGCGNYSEQAVDANLMNPAIRAELKKMQGDAASDVKAEEKWYSLFMEILIVPPLLGCSSWDVTGNALKIEPQSQLSTASSDAFIGIGEEFDDHNDFAGTGFADNSDLDSEENEDDIDSSEIAQPPIAASREGTIYPNNRGQQIEPETVTTELTPWMIDKNECVSLVRNQESEPHVPAFLGCMRTKGWFLKDQVENFELERKMSREMNTDS